MSKIIAGVSMQELINIESAFTRFDLFTKTLVMSLFKEEKNNGKSIEKTHKALINRASYGVMQQQKDL